MLSTHCDRLLQSSQFLQTLMFSRSQVLNSHKVCNISSSLVYEILPLTDVLLDTSRQTYMMILKALMAIQSILMVR